MNEDNILMGKEEGMPLIRAPKFYKGDAVWLAVPSSDPGGYVLVQGEVLDRGRRSNPWRRPYWVYQCIREDTNEVSWYVEDDVMGRSAP